MKTEIEFKHVTTAFGKAGDLAAPPRLFSVPAFCFQFRGHELAVGRICSGNGVPDVIVLFLPGHGAIEPPDTCPDLLLKIYAFLRRLPADLDRVQRHIEDIKRGSYVITHFDPEEKHKRVSSN